jgi:ABC-type uncharacterized transport system permease subunit
MSGLVAISLPSGCGWILVGIAVLIVVDKVMKQRQQKN